MLEKIRAEVKRLGEFAVGKRKLVPVKLFDNGDGLEETPWYGYDPVREGIREEDAGGNWIKKEMGLDFVPTGRVEVMVTRKDHQTSIEIDRSRLKPGKLNRIG